MINCGAAVRCTSSCNGPGAVWREHVAVMVGLSRCCWWQWCLWEQPQRPSVPCLASCTEVAGLRSSDITSRSESRYAGLWCNNSVGELDRWRWLSHSPVECYANVRPPVVSFQVLSKSTVLLATVERFYIWLPTQRFPLSALWAVKLYKS